MRIGPAPCRCAVCVKPSPRRTPAESTARYKRLRELEAAILMTRATAAGQWLGIRIGGRRLVYAPTELAAAMRRGFCYWHRAFWTLVDPPGGTGDHWRMAQQGTE